MAPTCTSNNPSEEDTPASSCTAATSPPSQPGEDLSLSDSEPFYGMFDRHGDDEDLDISWANLRLPANPRASSIPEASETFRRVMRQLDGLDDSGERAADSSVTDTPSATPSSEKRERKCSQAVKKSASFSASDCHCSSASSKDSAALAAEAKRRRSMPCMRGAKHVQWADEAGVADLVSVRLIRPRLAKGEKEEAQVSTPRSILRRLTGIH